MILSHLNDISLSTVEQGALFRVVPSFCARPFSRLNAHDDRAGVHSVTHEHSWVEKTVHMACLNMAGASRCFPIASQPIPPRSLHFNCSVHMFCCTFFTSSQLSTHLVASYLRSRRRPLISQRNLRRLLGLVSTTPLFGNGQRSRRWRGSCGIGAGCDERRWGYMDGP